ncbi:hypothetical protein [Cytobacillus horneckiae]|uniref:hypothetical protein n=1 Tax=Cytobacillus horneckiae TaxID=549687 RepID=UPI003D22E28A
MKLNLEEITVQYDVDDTKGEYFISFLFKHENCIAYDHQQVYLMRVKEVAPGLYEHEDNTKPIILGDIMRDDLSYKDYAARIIGHIQNMSIFSYLMQIYVWVGVDFIEDDFRLTNI